MKREEYLSYDATGLAELIRQGEVSGAEVTEAAIAQAEAVNPAINAICIPLFDDARKSATRDVNGPFAGVPFLAKDYGQEMAGVPATKGSRALRHVTPTQDGEYIRRCRQAGFTIMGRTTTPELALKAVTESKLWGPSRNPWDLDRTPGGSSGGAGAAVAAGIVPMAGASDGGGSIRIPAAYNGLFGLKPSRGRVSNGPFRDEGWQGASVDMVVSRSVRDSAAMLDVLSGAAPGDPFAIAPPVKPFAAQMEDSPGKLRIGFFTASPYDTAVAPECVQAVQEAAKLLESLGHHVEEAKPDLDGAAIARCYLQMYFGEVASSIAEARAAGASEQDFELETRVIGALGRSLSAGDFVRARHRWNDFGRSLGRFFTDYDLYLCPTTGQLPARIGEMDMPAAMQLASKALLKLRAGKLLLASGIVDSMAKENLARTPFTQMANLSGTPAMSVPLHWTEAGLPVGVQFGAAFGREGPLLSLAAQLEQARPWWAQYARAEACA